MASLGDYLMRGQRGASMQSAAQGGGIDPADVAQLLIAVSQAGPDIPRAVATMIQSAMQGQQLSIDVRRLGIDPALLGRVLSAAGNSGARMPDQMPGAGLLGSFPGRGGL